MESKLLNVLRGAPADAVPVLLTGAGCAAKLAGSSLEAMRGSAAEMARVQLDFQRVSGMDWIVIYSDAYYLPEALGCRVLHGEGGLEVAEPIAYERVLQAGAIDFDAVPSCRVVLDAVELAVRRAPQLPVGVLFEGPFTTAARMFGTEKMLMDLIMDPGTVTECLGAIARHLGGFTAEVGKRGASLIYLPDPMSSRDMISPDHYRAFARPYQGTVFEAARGAGLSSILHVCGNTKDRWADMAAAGADALSLDQVVDFADVRSAVGRSAVLAGNVDPVGAMLRGTPEQVRAEARKAFADAGPDRFILMPGCGTPPGAPAENLRALVDCGRSLRKPQ